MRIGFDAKRYFYNRTGLGNYSRSIVAALNKFASNLELFLYAPGKSSSSEKQHRINIAEAGRKGKWWRTFGVVSDLKRDRIKVYHGLSNELPFGLKQSGIGAVVTIHDVIFKRFPGYYPFFDRVIYHWKTKHALKAADVVVAASRATADDLDLFYPKYTSKVRVVYQPISNEWHSEPNVACPETEPYMLYVSSFTSRKNHGTLIEAFTKIAHQTGLNLILAGASGETLKQCENHISLEKLQARIKLYPNCDEAVLHALMHHASLSVNCSFFEGFGIPIAEAAAKNLPMAVSDIPVFRELAGEAARYFNPNDSNEMAAVIMESLIPEHQLQMQVGRGLLLSKIDPQKISEQLQEIYTMAAARHQ